MRAAAPLALEAAWDAAVDAEVVLAQAQVPFLDFVSSGGCCDLCRPGRTGAPPALEEDWVVAVAAEMLLPLVIHSASYWSGAEL